MGGIDAAIEECDGELAWPERFSPDTVHKIEASLGPYAWAGQYQQSPAPRGGGIFQRDWWQVWDPTEYGWPENAYPRCEYVIASLDSAFTEKEENDPSALTVWGVFDLAQLPRIESERRAAEVDEKTGQVWWKTGTQRRIILLEAWSKHLAFSGPRMERLDNEFVHDGMPEELRKQRNRRYRLRTQKHWGLIETVREVCQRRGVHKLLIEAKASGISAAQELANRYGTESYSIELIPVKGDKMARALACQATFSNMLVYAPDKDWADDVLTEMAEFPRAPHDDYTDSTTQAIAHLRARGLANTDDETTAAEIETVMHRGRPPRALYPV